MKNLKCYICDSSKVYPHSKVDNYTVVKCDVCGLVWVIDANENDIEDFYNESYFNNTSRTSYDNYLELEKNHRINAKRILKTVGRIKDLPNSKVLEVGCAFGFLLDEARKYTPSVYGVETSRYARDFALKQLRLENVNQDFSLFPKDFFDIVLFIGTIEHLASPKTVLADINRVLKPGGLLVVTTIDTKGLIPLYFIRPPDHLFYFNHSNMRLLLDKTGFRVVSRKMYFVNYSLSDLYCRLSIYLRLSFSKNILEGIKKFLNVSVNIPTNEMIIIAEKNI